MNVNPSVQIRYSYADCPTIEDFSNDNHFMRGLMGPIGSGKSAGCCIEIINRSLVQPPGKDGVRRSRWAVVRNTWPELRDTTIKTVFQWFPPHHFGKYVEAKHTYTITAFAGVHLELIFLALDKPDDVKKLLSLELTGAWVNEAREVPWPVIEMLGGRVGRFPSKMQGGVGWFGVIMDTNPPDSDSRWYKHFEELKPKNARLFKQPSGRGPRAENLTNLPGGRNYYLNLIAGKAAEWVKIYVDGEYGFLVEGKLVYPEYGDGIHCKAADPVPGVQILRGWDFGLTPACILTQMLPDGRFLVFDELVADNMSVDQFSDEVVEHCTRAFRGQAVFDDVGDPAGQNRADHDAKSVFQMLQAKGIQIRAAVTQNPTLRQESVRKPLRTLYGGEPQFILHPRCKMLRKGFLGGYHRRRLAVTGERYAEDPQKNAFSHPHDALQYAAAEHFAPALIGQHQDSDDDFYARLGMQSADPEYDLTRDEHTGY